MKFLKQIIIILLITTVIQSIVFAEISSQTKEITTLDLSLILLPPFANIKIWREKHGLEFYPPNQAKFLDATGYYLRYMYKFYDDYYLGIGYYGLTNSSGQTSGGLFGSIGREFTLNDDWLIANFDLVYVPAVPPSQNLLFPTAQIGVRFKI